MMVLISYDVSTTDSEGKTRLRKVAKECQNHAQRVQNSVFEADLDYSTFLKLKARLIKLIDERKGQPQVLLSRKQLGKESGTYRREGDV